MGREVDSWVRRLRDRYFPVCPFCKGKVTIQYSQAITLGRRKSTANCLDCGAKWHLIITSRRDHTLDVRRGMLIEDGIDCKGTAYLNEWYDGSVWKGWSMRAKRKVAGTVETEKPPVDVRVKEIIKEKEVIVKVRCPYCRNLFDEQLDMCPHCGGKR